MTDKKQNARQLYLTTGKSQKEIALEVGVSERTIYTWVHQFAWQKLREAALQAPATIIDNLCSQLVELQNAIATREPGKRYPTTQEAEISKKLISGITGMKKSQSLAQHMQTMESFREFVSPLNAQFSKQLAHYSEKFFAARSKNGYHPYDLEYGPGNSPVAPFCDEFIDDELCDSGSATPHPIPCTTIGECGRTTGCDWPKCRIDTFRFNDSETTNRKLAA